MSGVARSGIAWWAGLVAQDGGRLRAPKVFSTSGMEIGSSIRVIREPYFGRLGKVADLPPELRQLETEAKVRVLEVEFEPYQLTEAESALAAALDHDQYATTAWTKRFT
jgi:hypothetical protein